MARNKVIFGNETLIDLTPDTVTKEKVLSGYTFHGNDGESYEGECTFDADTQDATATNAEVLNTKTYYAQGAKKTGSMPNRGKATGTISTKDGIYNIQQGYHDGSGTVALASSAVQQLIPANIREGVTILGITGNMSASEGENPEDSKEVTPTNQDQTITPSSGYTCMREVVVKAIPYTEIANSYGTTVKIG